MYFAEDRLFFGRAYNGSVRVIKFKQTPVVWPTATSTVHPADVEFDFTLPPTTWASIVAGVSARGDGEGRFYVAQAFHMNPPINPQQVKADALRLGQALGLSACPKEINAMAQLQCNTGGQGAI